MANISITYPETWLTLFVSIINVWTSVTDFTGTAIEITNSKAYLFDFQEEKNTDYVYVITTPGYDDVSWVMYRDWGWLTFEENDHLMNMTRSSWGIVIDNTKKNEELIEKMEKFEKLLEKYPSFELQDIKDIVIKEISAIEQMDPEVLSDYFQKIKISLQNQRSLIRDLLSKEREESLNERIEFQKEISDFFDIFDKNLEEKNVLLREKDYDIEEKEKEIEEKTKSINEIKEEKEREEEETEELVKELLQISLEESNEMKKTEKALVQAYIDNL